MRRTVLLLTTAGALGGLTACGRAGTTATSSPTSGPVVASSSAAAVPSTPAPAPAVTTPVVTTPVVTTSAPTSAPFVAFAMPRFVGMDLQSAQDAVQTHGIFYSRSHDLRGVRHQVLDSDWMVCTQNIPAGTRVTSDIEGQIDFGVVKRAESCP
jgi:hypothetical protein